MAADDEDFGTYDYIIAGAGSSGCVLANRLSANPRNKVLVLEAGGRDSWIWFHIPVGYIFAIGDPRADWRFTTVEEPGLGGRSIAYPRGRVIGGSSSINAMIYMRGQAADYDGWRQLGLTGWGWDDVLPYFLKHEDHIDGDGPFHHAGGELRVEHPRVKWEILEAIRDAAECVGIPRIPDFNTGDNEGSSPFQQTQRKGRRWSAATAFLKPVLNRPNLRLETGVTVEQVLLEGRRAVGIAFQKHGKRHVARASGEVILSTGAVATPKILELSGIGDPEVLQRWGIETRHAAPGVGKNLQDHLQLRPMWKVSGVRTLNTDYANLFKRAMMGVEYAFRRTGAMTMAPSQVGIFAKSSPEFATANVQFHVQPLSLPKFGEPLHRFAAITLSVCNLRPTSRGTVSLRSRDPHDAPVLALNYLSTEEDRRVAVDSLRLARRIADQKPLARYRPEEFFPGPQYQTDAELIEAAGLIGTTIFHPVGTAAMGPEHDRMAVLDERMRVRGLDRLRVIDASAMPRIVSGNTNAPSIMMGEKGAAMVLEDSR